MDGVKRPKYFNERDRRLKGDEEARLLDAAHSEDRKAGSRLVFFCIAEVEAWLEAALDAEGRK